MRRPVSSPMTQCSSLTLRGAYASQNAATEWPWCFDESTAGDWMQWGGIDVKRLNGMDAYLLYTETPSLHSHTLKVAVIDASGFGGEFGFEEFRTHFRRRLHLLEPLRDSASVPHWVQGQRLTRKGLDE